MAEKKDGVYQYQPLWGKWYIELPLGQGSFGTVYKIGCEEMGYRYASAVKVITIPSEEQYRDAKASFGNDEETLTGYFEDIVRNIVGEINMLYSLSGNSNIVGYQDHQVIKKKDAIGWDVLIRMELVTSLPKYLEDHRFSREQVLQLGLDICTALELCSKKGIIHRDIKDENIFISKDGFFKLGDFGIAKELSKSGRAASIRGTPLYMAPEVFRGEKYDAAIDIYSLGIVLYKLLNGGRMPFMPPYPQPIKFKDGEDALERRIAGEQLPPPQFAGERLSAVVRRACAFKAEDRYASATEMKQALEGALASMDAAERLELVTPERTKKTDPAETNDEQPSEAEGGQSGSKVERTISIYEEGISFEGAQPQARKNAERTIGVADGIEKPTERNADMPRPPIDQETRGDTPENGSQKQGQRTGSASDTVVTDRDGLEHARKYKLTKKVLFILKISISALMIAGFIIAGFATVYLSFLSVAQIAVVLAFRKRPSRGDIINIVFDICIIVLLFSGCAAAAPTVEITSSYASTYTYVYSYIAQLIMLYLLISHIVVSIISLRLEAANAPKK